MLNEMLCEMMILGTSSAINVKVLYGKNGTTEYIKYLLRGNIKARAL